MGLISLAHVCCLVKHIAVPKLVIGAIENALLHIRLIKQSELILTRQCPISSEYSSIHIPINPFWSDSLVEDVLKRIFDSSKTHFLNASENYVFQTAAEIMKSRIERYRPESKSHYYCENSSGKDGFCTLTANLCGSKEPDCNSCSKLVIKNINAMGYCIDR